MPLASFLSDVISETLYCVETSPELTNCTYISSLISSILDKLVPLNSSYRMLKDTPFTRGIPAVGALSSPNTLRVSSRCITVPILILLVLINSGASFSIAKTLYFVEFSITFSSPSSPLLKYR